MEQENNNHKFILSVFFKKNKIKLLVIISLIILIIFGIIILDEVNKNKVAKLSETFNKAQILIKNDKKDEALNSLKKIINQNETFYSPSALNLIIENNLIKDEDKIIYLFNQILKDTKPDEETKNLIIIKKTFFIGDKIEEADLLKTFKPIIQSNSIWKSTASDYIKKYYISKREFEKAKEFKFENK